MYTPMTTIFRLLPEPLATKLRFTRSSLQRLISITLPADRGDKGTWLRFKNDFNNDSLQQKTRVLVIIKSRTWCNLSVLPPS